MKAVVLHRAGEPEELHLEEVTDPIAGSDEVVVRVRAAALNHRDLYICRGQYAGLRFPIILGSDGVGDIDTVGSNVTHLERGRRVVINPTLEWGEDVRVQRSDFRILGLPDDGTFAELVRVPAANVVSCPAALSDEEAAAIPLAGLTAYRAVVTRGAVQAGEAVLILGIGGGVATCVMLIAKKLGARIFVTSGSDEKLARARGLGAEDGFNYRTTNWVESMRAATGGQGPDVVIDGTGGPIFDQALDAVRPGGRVISYGATAGVVPQLTVRRIFWKQLDVRGSTMGSPDDFQSMIGLFTKDGLRPVIDRVFPLAEAGKALRHMDERAQFGKIVLRGS